MALPFVHWPIFVVCDDGELSPNGWRDQDETWHPGRPRPGHIALDGEDPDPSPKKGHSPQFSVHARCGQTAGWIKMTLGMAVGLGPGDFVLDGKPCPVPPQKRTQPLFLAHVYCGQTAGWIKMPLGK